MTHRLHRLCAHVEHLEVSALAAFLIVLAVGPLQTARAQEVAAGRSPLVLEWHAPASCPTRERVWAQIAEMLGREPTTLASEPLSASIDVSDLGRDRWSMRMQVTTSTGTEVRALTATSCTRLAESAAVILAVAIDPNAHVELGSDAVAAPSPAPSPPPSVPREAARSFDVLARVDGEADVGTFARLEASIGVAAGIVFGRGRVEIGATHWHAQTVDGPRQGTGARLEGITIDLRGCFMPSVGTFIVGGCVVTESGALFGRGFGVTRPSSGTGVWFAALAGPVFAWRPVRAIALRLAFEAGPALVRPHFYFDGFGTVHEPSAIIVRIFAGLEIHFF